MDVDTSPDAPRLTGVIGEGGRPPTVGIAGRFDVASFGDLLSPRLFEQEMHRRIPGCVVRSFAPFGRLHPVSIDGGRNAEPLGAWTRSRAREISESLDAFVIGGGELAHTVDAAYAAHYERDTAELIRMQPSRFFIEGLGPAIERRCPTAWHGVGVPFDFDEPSAARIRAALDDRQYVTVRDELSRDRVLAAGVERDVAVVPDSALVLDRFFDGPVLERRLRHLKQLGQYPQDERPIVVQGSGMLLRQVEGLVDALASTLAAHADRAVVFIEIGPCHGDGDLIDAVLPRCSNPVHRLPSDAPAEDIVAVIANAGAYVGLSLHGALTATVYDVPMAILNQVRLEKLDGFARLLGEPELVAHEVGETRDRVDRAVARESGYPARSRLRMRVDGHFDRLAEMLLDAHRERGAAPDNGTDLGVGRDQRVAYAARTAQLLRERAMFEELLADADAELSDVRVQLVRERWAAAVLRGRIEHAEREVHRVNTELRRRLEEVQARARDLERRLAERDGTSPSPGSYVRLAVAQKTARAGVSRAAAAMGLRPPRP